MAKQRKTTTRKRVRKTRKKQSKFSFFIFFIIIIALIPAGISIYFLSQKYFIVEKSTYKKTEDQNNELMKKMRKMLDDERKRIAQNVQKVQPKISKEKEKPKTNIKKEENLSKKIVENSAFEPKSTESLDYEKSLKEANLKHKEPKVEKKAYKGKPKLAIIIDDVSFEYHLNRIKKTGLKITPSFLPPNKIHPDSAKIAEKTKFYMVHLPLEAISHNSPEYITLKTTDSFDYIEANIKKFKKLFPKAIYYNNHTGSKFTANQEAMDKLYRIFKEQNLVFIDSKTTALSKAESLAKKYHIKYHARDVFLDNSLDLDYIKNQLKLAVKIAKQKGYAIAIGHPHKNTLKAIKNSKKDILKDVEVVYLKDLK